jgi:tetratricopeptide (TPR) repeat protein
MGVLEKTIVGIIESAGGKVDSKRRIITGIFDEHSLGVWLSIISALETILGCLKEAESELYGYALVVSRDLADYEITPLCSNLASRLGGTGVWCAPSVQVPLSPYIAIEEKIPETDTPVSINGEEITSAESSLIRGYARLRILKTFTENGASPENASPARSKELFPFREKILRLICYGSHRNAALFSPAFTGKRDGVYQFCAETLGEYPPLILRFNSRSSIGYFADILTPRIRAFIAESGVCGPEQLEALDRLQAVLFRERLMQEYSDYLLQDVRRFFEKILTVYRTVMKQKKSIPILIIERIHCADDTAMRLCVEVLKNIPNKTEFLVYGTFSYQPAPQPTEIEGIAFTDTAALEAQLQTWKGIFPRIIKFTPEECPARSIPEMSRDLWEIAYSAHLLGRYFPGFLFSQLFEEEERKSNMMRRAFAILTELGVIDYSEDPAPRIPDFAALAEKNLGDRKDRIRRFARNRLLAWIFSGRLRPCFSLLEILAELGERGGDKLILEAVSGDVMNGTFQEIERAVAEKRFDAVVGEDKGPALQYIFVTLKALMHGNAETIRNSFQNPPPVGDFFSGYKIQILANLAGYYLGLRNIETALEVVKEAMLIGQGQKQGIAHVYRLFALVNLSKQQVDDSLDYISFAVDNAEKSEQFDELGVASYYAAAAQFLFGNLSKAEQLALKAEQTAGASNRPGWVDKAKFLRGKLRFEMGYYQEALEIFTHLQKHPAGSVSEEMACTISAWIYRSLAYTGAQNPKSPAVLGYDGSLFEIEASYMTGNYAKTLALSKKTPPAFPEESFLYTERPDWRSGFTQGELLVLSHKDLWNRIAFAYRSLALCRVPEAGDEREQAIRQMQRFTRDSLLPDSDPNDIFHFYVYYRMLLESNASEIDRNTAVSIAFRRLQRRANRIDDMEARKTFLNSHYWNSTLTIAAKDHKLI